VGTTSFVVRVALLALCASVGAAAPAVAKTPAAPMSNDAREAAPAVAAKPVSSPSSSSSSSIGTKLSWSAHGAPRLLWTGFRAGPDGGEVLLQTSAAVDVGTRATKDGIVYVLRGCRLLRHIDSLPLETRYFDSPVTRVSLRAHAGSIEVAVALRHPVDAAPRKEAGPNGSWFWVLSFPTPAPASAAKTPAPAKAAPARAAVARD